MIVRIKGISTSKTDQEHRVNITILLEGGTVLEYSINENTIKNKTEEQVLAFIDLWMDANGYEFLPGMQVWVHKNDDGTWAIAYGSVAPSAWPEDDE